MCGKQGWVGPHGISTEDADFMGFEVFDMPCPGSFAGGEGGLEIEGLEDIGAVAIGGLEKYAGSLPLGPNNFDDCALGVTTLEIRETSEA